MFAGGVNSLFLGVGCGIGTGLCGFFIDAMGAVNAFRSFAAGTLLLIVFFAVSQVAYYYFKSDKEKEHRRLLEWTARIGHHAKSPYNWNRRSLLQNVIFNCIYLLRNRKSAFNIYNANTLVSGRLYKIGRWLFPSFTSIIFGLVTHSFNPVRGGNIAWRAHTNAAREAPAQPRPRGLPFPKSRYFENSWKDPGDELTIYTCMF